MKLTSALWIGAGVGLVYLVSRGAEARPAAPAVTPRPGDPPPGPLARRMGELVSGLTESERQQVRSIMPDFFWTAILASTMQPSDDLFSLSLHPITIEVAIWPTSKRRQFEGNLVSAIGMWDAMELDSILQTAEVL